MKIFLILILLSYSALALELRRETSLPVGDCDTSNYSPALVKATAHVNAIKDRIVAANPDVFRDDLAPARICAGVHNVRSQRAWAATRSFVVEAGMILRVQNDAQLAYVVAHELAHLTMRHNLDGLPLRNPTDAVKAAKRRWHLLSEEISALDKSSPSHAANYEAVNTRLEAARAIVSNAIISEFGADFEKNWDEAEAELVGSHLFLRAGFSGAEIGWRVQQLAMGEAAGQDPHSPAPQISSSERISAALRACGAANVAAFTEPARGGGPYATPCWTIWK